MSYILEALKKSQHERQAGRIPTLDTPPAPSINAAPAASRWTLGALGLALMAMVVALFAVFGLPRDTGDTGNQNPAVPTPETSNPAQRANTATAEKDSIRHPQSSIPAPAPVPVSVAEPVNRAVARVRQPIPMPATRPTTNSRQSPIEQPAPLATTGHPVPAESQSPAVPAQSPVTASKGENAVIDSRTAPGVANAPVVEESLEHIALTEPVVIEVTPPEVQRPQSMENLPAEIHQALPPMRISAHVYSEVPKQRFIILNSDKLKEGESTLDGLRLEEVRRDGTIFQFHGHRFFRQR